MRSERWERHGIRLRGAGEESAAVEALAKAKQGFESIGLGRVGMIPSENRAELGTELSRLLTPPPSPLVFEARSSRAKVRVSLCNPNPNPNPILNPNPNPKPKLQHEP